MRIYHYKSVGGIFHANELFRYCCFDCGTSILGTAVKLCCKKGDNEWQRVVQRMTRSGTASDNGWQRVTMSGKTNDNKWQRVTASGTTSGNEWQRVVQQMTTSDNEWYNDWQQRYRDLFKPILIIGFCFTIF